MLDLRRPRQGVRLERQFLNPNFHVILIHYPLGLLTIGTLIELFSFLWRRHSFRAAGRWMILIGTLLAVPTTLSGIYALWDVANPTHDEANWHQIATAGHLTDPQWKFLIYHLRMMAIATAISLVAVVTWLGSSDDWRRRLHVPLTVLLLGSVGLMVAGSWYAGETVYTQGTAVKLPPTSMPDAPVYQQKIDYFASPMQAHTIMAGLTNAMALVSLGLSFRKLTQPMPSPQMDHIAAALEPTYEETPAEPVGTTWLPVSRFWLIASLLGVGTAAGGFYLIGTQPVFNTFKPAELWTDITQNKRLLAHLIGGSSLILLPLVLAGLARWGYRQRVVLLAFSLLLLVATSFQIWMGILLLLDTSQGVVTKFN